MHLRALLISRPDNGLSESVRALHHAAADGLRRLLHTYNVATELSGGPSSAPAFRPDLVFILTPMTCWYPGPRGLVALVRRLYERAPVILIETVTTLSLRHALETSGADYVHTGEMGEELGFILQTFGLRIRSRRPASARGGV